MLPRGGAAVSGAGDESLGDFVRRRLGREALERIAEPIVAGIHAGDPERMSVRATFPMFLEMEQQHRSLIMAMLQRRKARQKAAAQGPPRTPRLDSRARRDSRPARASRRPARAPTSTRSRPGSRT